MRTGLDDGVPIIDTRAPSKAERLEALRKVQQARTATSERIQWAKREGFAAWRTKLMAPVFAAPRGTAARTAAYLELARKLHTAPDGNGAGQISLPTLKGWVTEMERGGNAEHESDDAAVEATPAAAFHVEASQPLAPWLGDRFGCVIEPVLAPEEEASAPVADARPRVRATTYSQRTLQRERQKRLQSGERLLTVVADRPLTRAECIEGPRPCPFVSCKYHLYLDVTEVGSLKLNFPHLEPDQMAESCALDVVDKHGTRTLEEVGGLLNMTRERVRQVEEEILAGLKEPARDYDLHLMAEHEFAPHDPMESMPDTLTNADALHVPGDPSLSWRVPKSKEATVMRDEPWAVIVDDGSEVQS